MDYEISNLTEMSKVVWITNWIANKKRFRLSEQEISYHLGFKIHNAFTPYTKSWNTIVVTLITLKLIFFLWFGHFWSKPKLTWLTNIFSKPGEGTKYFSLSDNTREQCTSSRRSHSNVAECWDKHHITLFKHYRLDLCI